jgi:hypothetical protein
MVFENAASDIPPLCFQRGGRGCKTLEGGLGMTAGEKVFCKQRIITTTNDETP